MQRRRWAPALAGVTRVYWGFNVVASVEADFYELLEVERTADDKAIKSAYRRLAMQCHPDKNPGCGDSEARFKKISQAYDCLKDPQKRAAYDRFGHAAFENGGMGNGGGGQGFSDLGDIFETIFGNGFGGGRQQARAQFSDPVQPRPWQVSHLARASMVMVFSTPVKASSRLSSRS